MKPAPKFNCDNCARVIGKARGHYLLDDGRVTCGRCVDRAAHRSLFPDCSHGWHDALDHLEATGTRAGVAAALGVWP